MLLQTGPQTFQVLLGGGRIIDAHLSHDTRRGLGLTGQPPLAVATELVRFLAEREDLAGVGSPLYLGAAAGKYPEFVDEIRARLS